MFRRILLWFGGMLVFSFAAFVGTSFWLSSRPPMRDSVFRGLVEFQLSEAIRAYQTGGQPALQDLLSRLDRHFPARHYLTDANGRDLMTGEDRSELLQRRPNRRRFPLLPPKQILIRQVSADRKYALLIEGPIRSDPWSNLAAYGWIVLVIILLCYALAWTLARPIRHLREAVVRFGSGDLTSRTHSRRKDELGDLARAFDQMADRIQTLLTAERRLLQDVSHELRSPLTRLRFALELARGSPDPKAALGRVTKEVDRVSTLVGELLQVTRAEGDPESRNVAAIDLRAFLEALVEDCRIEAEAGGCSIDVSVRKDVIWQGDRELLHRALENIVRNALRHAPKGTAVAVELDAEPNQVIVRIRDYGPGVPEDQLEEIFRPFYRVEQDRSRENGGGVGLGLAIAQRAIRLHHGDIRASNASPGLLVEVRLPR
jgi:two-component system sensor histidine kinase CpxA